MTNTTNKTILSYGIGEDYLKDWTILEALREIFQNFIDYGEFKTITKIRKDKNIVLQLTNTYITNNLDFLQIGKSVKNNENSIGKHGEGLKMAFLVCLRERIHISINVGKFLIYPTWIEQEYIGKTLGVCVIDNFSYERKFNLSIKAPIEYKQTIQDYIDNILTKEDLLFTDSYHGSIVNKPKGNLYSGRLFVTNLPNLSKSYDIPPRHLSLDRDRRIPSSFGVSYHTSKINEALFRKKENEAKLDFVDQDYDDAKYISYVPTNQLNDIKPKEILGKVEFVTEIKNKETGEKEEVIINNPNIKEYLKNQSIFSKAINSIKSYVLSKLGIKDLIINFRNKYCHSDEMKEDFDNIINKLGIKLD